MPPRKIDPQALAAWTGTDAAFAAQAGVTPQAVAQARQRATQAAPIPVRKPLGKSIQKAILREAARRGVSVVQVLEDCRVALALKELDQMLRAVDPDHVPDDAVYVAIDHVADAIRAQDSVHFKPNPEPLSDRLGPLDRDRFAQDVVARLTPKG